MTTATAPKARTLQARLAVLTDDQQAQARELVATTRGTDADWRRALDAAELPTVPTGVPTTDLLVAVQTDTCGRCCGTGRYSFNLMDGDRCYGCHGRGLVATKLGRAASAALAEWRDTVGSVLPGQLKVGDRYVGSKMNGAPVVREVTEVALGGVQRGSSDGVPYERQMVELRSQGHRNSVYADKPVRLPLTGELWERYVAHAATIPGVVITAKTSE